MKYILSLLTAFSLSLFSSCGGGGDAHDHNGSEECCGECQDEANASE